MNIINRLFNRGNTELEDKVAQLESIIEKSALNDSLIAFNSSGGVEWYNTGKSDRYGSHYTIYRGIDMLASLGAGLPFDIYRGDQVIDNVTQLGNGFNIHKPHPNMSFNQLLYTALIYYFYRGELMIEISDDPFFHLVPINPKSMTRITGTQNWKFSEGSSRRTILEENLIYLQLFNPDATDRGLSPVDVVKADLMNESSAIQYNTKFFENFGQIGGFFYDSAGKALSKDMKQIVDQYEYLHKGSSKAYKTLGLPGGIRYEEFAQSMRELQYLESRKDIRDRILAVLGIHKALFGITDQVNRSVSEEATRMLWIHNLKPKMVMVQEKINQTLFRRYFPQYEFTFNFSDIAELSEAFDSIEKQAKLLQALGYTTNEINKKLDLGMEDMTDPRGDMRLVPTGFVPAEDFMYEDEPDAESKAINVTPNALLGEYLEPENKSLRAQKSRYLRHYNKLYRHTSRKMAGKLGKFFSKELGQIVKIILSKDKMKASVDINSVLAEIQNQITINKEQLQQTVKPIYAEGSAGADKLALTSIGSQADPIANEAVVAGLTNKVANVSNHTYRMIRTQIKDGVNAGDSIEQIAKRVSKVYKMQSSRARIIARTETGSVIHRTTDERYKSEGVQKKEWLTAGDSEVRDSHAQNGGIGPVDYDYVYPNGQSFPNDGGGDAADNINCRCTFIAVIE